MKAILIFLIVIILFITLFCIFFDEAILSRKGTIFHNQVKDKVVALTFDDGPSPLWTPKILDELKQAGVKATFFMIGEHVDKYRQIAKRVAEDGHEIENHTYDHRVLIYYKLPEVEREIKSTEKIIREVTSVTTHYFRPPKAWLTAKEKKKIKEMGYKIVLWSLNSKDWVTFDDKYITDYLVNRVHPGDIILFHDSGGVFGTEGGNRAETVKTIPELVQRLRRKGFRFVTVNELIELKNED